MGTVAIKALEFVDDIADLNSGSENAANSNKIIVGIQECRRLTFAAEKCRILKINSFDFSNSVCVKGEDLKVVTQFKYLGDVLNSRGDNSEMIKDRVGKAVGTTNEIISLSVKKSTLAKIKFLICYYHIDQSSFLGLYITVKHGLCLLKEVTIIILKEGIRAPKVSFPTAALYLELGIFAHKM